MKIQVDHGFTSDQIHIQILHGSKNIDQEQDPIFISVSKIISDCLLIDIEKVSVHSRLSEDLGMDSLDEYELIYSIAPELGVSIHEDAVYELKTVLDIVEYVKAKQADSEILIPPTEPVQPKNRMV